MMHLTKEQKIQIRKKLSRLDKKSINFIDNKNCLLCNKSVNGFCKSHSVPQFVLKNIAINGNVFSASKIYGIEQVVDNKIGIMNAGTFFNICNCCDSSFFRDYESIEQIELLARNIKNKQLAIEDQNILLKIMIKSLLKEIYTKQKDVFKMPIIYDEKILGLVGAIHNEPYVSKLNIRDYLKEFEECKASINKKDSVVVYDYIELPYMVSVATQALISLQKDMDGEVINDVFNYDERYRILDTCWCIFPINNKTYIFIFGLKETKERYKQFFKKYKKLNLQQKLKLLQAVVFSNTEEIYFSQYLEDYLLKDETFSSLVTNSVKKTSVEQVFSTIMFKEGEVDISKFDQIKNCYFNRKYSIISLKTKHSN